MDLDPQDLVQPQSNAITLTIPAGFRFGALPEGWSATSAQTAVLWVPQLTRVELVAGPHPQGLIPVRREAGRGITAGVDGVRCRRER